MDKEKKLKQLEIGFHIIFWITYTIYPILKFGDQEWFSMKYEEAAIDVFLAASSVYITLYLISKNFPKSIVIPFLLLLYLLMTYTKCTYYISTCNCSFNHCFITNLIHFGIVNFFFIGIQSIKENVQNRQAFEKAEKEKVQSELKGLKAQLNPHFLFNTLNMLYANALSKDEILANKILQLSDSLHYLLHEGEKKEVTISKEIAFLEGYIALQKARLGKKINISFRRNIDNLSQKIPPLLMIAFVENAFKYASMVEGSDLPLLIDLHLEKGIFTLQVRNKYTPNYAQYQPSIWKESGIGIENTKRRLALLFPKKHDLQVQSENDIYTIHLKIQLS